MNLMSLNLNILITSEFWTTVSIFLAISYCGIAIAFEVAEILFLLTPTDKDDKWLARQKVKWEIVKPFLKWFQVKTPITLLLNKILKKLETIKDFIKNRKDSKNDKK